MARRKSKPREFAPSVFIHPYVDSHFIIANGEYEYGKMDSDSMSIDSDYRIDGPINIGTNGYERYIVPPVNRQRCVREVSIYDEGGIAIRLLGNSFL